MMNVIPPHAELSPTPSTVCFSEESHALFGLCHCCSSVPSYLADCAHMKGLFVFAIDQAHKKDIDRRRVLSTSYTMWDCLSDVSLICVICLLQHKYMDVLVQKLVYDDKNKAQRTFCDYVNGF